ncbi:putative catalytic [Capsicum annuum]|uniref:Uncharacterized protein n=1 Tax=Capsicum annuum TaxID=4072 RepID=A0A1U8FS18_CAPAN|nr:photosystem I assembly factor PSA3, chloroplastic-like [Capsicum annuum]KAF3618531.1 putative catalytic [Capsicum annuum]PHT92066.1 hypothetical protein T459_07179 [Capsicum annuum]
MAWEIIFWCDLGGKRWGKKVGGDLDLVLLCCWLAAVGAGLLKSEEILEGVARFSLANDIEFEEQNFIALMNEAREKQAKLGPPTPKIPMDVIHVWYFGRDLMEEEDEKLLSTMLNAVFPTNGQQKVESIVKEKAKRVGDGTEEIKYIDANKRP